MSYVDALILPLTGLELSPELKIRTIGEPLVSAHRAKGINLNKGLRVGCALHSAV